MQSCVDIEQARQTKNKLFFLYLTVFLRSTAHQNQGDVVHSFGWLEARTHSKAIVQSKVNRNEILKYLLGTQYLHTKMNINTINIYFHSFNLNNICSINQINSTQCSIRCAMYRFGWLDCHFLSPSLSFASFNFDCREIKNRWRKSRGELLKKWVNGCSLAICWWSATSLRYSLTPTPYSRKPNWVIVILTAPHVRESEYLLHVEEHLRGVLWWWWSYTLANYSSSHYTKSC